MIHRVAITYQCIRCGVRTRGYEESDGEIAPLGQNYFVAMMNDDKPEKSVCNYCRGTSLGRVVRPGEVC